MHAHAHANANMNANADANVITNSDAHAHATAHVHAHAIASQVFAYVRTSVAATMGRTASWQSRDLGPRGIVAYIRPYAPKLQQLFGKRQAGNLKPQKIYRKQRWKFRVLLIFTKSKAGSWEPRRNYEHRSM